MPGKSTGFPLRVLKTLKERAILAGIQCVVVAERGLYPSGLRKRIVTEIFRVEDRTA